MDYSTEDILESNWVFVEEVDIAEEALDDLNLSQKHDEANNSSQDSLENISKCITKSCSDSQLVTQNDNLHKSLNKLSLDHDSESDGLSVISNWSYSQEMPEEILDDNDDIENDKKPTLDIKYSDYIQELQNSEDEEIQKQDEELKKHDQEKQRHENEDIDRCAADELQNLMDDEDVGKEIMEDGEDILMDKDKDECFRGHEVEDNPDLSERSFPILCEEKNVSFGQYLLELDWSDDSSDTMEDIENDHDFELLFSKIAEGIQKNVSVSGFLIGTVLIAASSFFLGRYFTTTETIQDDLPTYQENGFLYDVPNEEHFDVQTALSFCREKHRSDDIYMEINAQKCLNKIEKRMKCKKHNKLIKEGIQTWEKYLEAKEKFLIEKERKLSRQEALFRYKHKKYDKNDEIVKKMQYVQCNIYNNIKTDKKADSNGKNYRRENNINKHLQQNQKCKDDSKEKKIKSREDTKQITVDNQNLKHKNKENHYRDTSKERMHKMGGNSGKICKKTGDIYKKFDFQMRANENFNAILKAEENQKNHEYFVEEKLVKQDKGKDSNPFSKVNSDSCQKNKKQCKRAKNKYQQNYEQNLLKSDRNNETVDGDWLSKLFRGRSDLRSRENKGEWYFDRSSYRKRKRDKAKWYFDWMMDREILRYRRLYLNL